MNYFTIFASLLKDRYAFLDEIHQGIQLKNKISALMLSSFLCFGIYGAIIGSFHSPLQALSSAIKLPALYLITLVVCLPALFIFNALFGSTKTVTQHFTYVLSSASVIALMLCGFAPVTLFFLITIDPLKDYSFYLLLNVVIFGLTGVFGVSFLYQAMRPANVGKSPHILPETAADPEARLSEIPPSVSVQEELSLNRNVETDPNVNLRSKILKLWLFLYGFVGSQLGWTLRPFFGSPGNFELFRPRDGNFLTGVFHHIQQLF